MMDQPNQAQFLTIIQIANALGVSRQAVSKTLEHVPASGVVILKNGLTAKGWGLFALPESTRARLTHKSRENGFHDVLDYVMANREPWVPPLPFPQVFPKWQSRAFALQRALIDTLKSTQGGPLGGDALRGAVSAYENVMGVTVTPDHIRRLYTRTAVRDRGLMQWDRVELFLDDAAFRKSTCTRPAKQRQYSHQELSDVLELIDRKNPGGDDKAIFFDAAFLHFESLCENHPKEDRRIKASLLAFINGALPTLSKSVEALRRMFDQKFSIWRENRMAPAALDDKRALNSGRRQKDFSADIKTIADLAVQFEGNESRAQREAYKRGLLSAEYVEHYKLKSRRNKFYVPRAVRTAATDQVIKMEPFLKGPRAVRKAMPRPFRNWDDLMPGDVFEADDLTIPFYWRTIDETGIERVIRGECLVFVDRRSGMILDFMLIAGKYNSFDIRWGAGIKIPCKYGKPRQGWLFEKGVWRSRLIDGDRIPGANSLSWRQSHRALSGGFEESGMSVKHARPGNPQTKIIEQIFNVTQNRMAIEPGFTGRNERMDGYDRALRLIAQARAGKQSCLDQLYTHAECVRALEIIFAEYNAEPQNGKRLAGASPIEMWSDYVSRFPLEKLPDEAQFLYASHKRVMKPRRDGSFLLEYGGTRRMFFNGQTGELSRTDDVIVWWHIEQPNLITITDRKGLNPFVVKEVVMKSSTATEQEFEEVRKLQKQCMEPGRVRFSNMQRNLINTITRDNSITETARELGRFNRQAIEEVEAEEKTKENQLKRIRKDAAEMGVGVNTSRLTNPDRVEEGLRREREIRERLENKKAEQA